MIESERSLNRKASGESDTEKESERKTIKGEKITEIERKRRREERNGEICEIILM